MGEPDTMTKDDVREVEAYLRAMSALPPAPASSKPDETGWYVQSPSAAVTYGYEPWLQVSEVEVAYLAPALMVRLNWSSSGSDPESFMLILDAHQMNAEKCIIRIETFLSRERWFADTLPIGIIRAVPVTGRYTPEPIREP